MSDQNPLDPSIERLLRTAAVWEELSPSVETAILDNVESPEPESRRYGWLVAGAAAVAALIIGFVALSGDDPDWAVAVVAAPESGISGEVLGWNEPTGTRLVLEMNNLEPAAPGTFYEVWWVADDGSVSSGSFLESDTIEMWMGIRRSDFPKMLITLEPSDGDPAPSGDVVAWSDD